MSKKKSIPEQTDCPNDTHLCFLPGWCSRHGCCRGSEPAPAAPDAEGAVRQEVSKAMTEYLTCHDVVIDVDPLADTVIAIVDRHRQSNRRTEPSNR